MKKWIGPLFQAATCIFILVFCAAIGCAGAQSARTGTAQGEIDPFSITLYAEYNYQKPIGTWTLAPGMRMLKIPELNAMPASALLGEKVSAIIFPNSHFASTLRGATKKSLWSGEATETYLIPYWRIKGSSNNTFGKYYPSTPCSFILHRKDIGDFLGVYLESAVPLRQYGQFFPLPEKARETAIVYNKVIFEPFKAAFRKPLLLRLEPGGTGQMSLYPSNTPPNPNNIAVTITTPEGATVKLPEHNSTTTQFNLSDPNSKYRAETISSLRIEYKGPFTEQAYLPAQAVRAPTAPDVAQPPVVTKPPVPSGLPGQPKVASVPDVSGEWKSNIGLVYQIVQTGDRFQWTVKGSKEQASGTIAETSLSASWTGPQGGGSASGKITKTDAQGRAVEIDWNNGVRFMR